MDVGSWTLGGNSTYDHDQRHQGSRDTVAQLVISFTLGLTAFLAFCVMRPRWKGLYAARKRQTGAAASLPELPDTFLGWIPVLYRINDKEVLASAGLDAFVFLSFFRLAIKFLAIAFFLAIIIMTPVHHHFFPKPKDQRLDALTYLFAELSTVSLPPDEEHDSANGPRKTNPENPGGYLWMHAIFVYVFTTLLIYLLVTETRKIIKIRQDYLGSQSTVTDRTIRLSGIPPDLRSEEKLKEWIESLAIGKVERVTLIKNWRELDHLMAERASVLRKLEEAWTVHLGSRRVERNLESLPIVQPPPPDPVEAGDEEQTRLLGEADRTESHLGPYARERPTTTIRYGFLNLESKKIDAIDYYEEKLRKLDEKIKVTRKKTFPPTSLAFVTMDSTAACQMAVQAILDPSPMQLLAKPAPAPTDIVWTNTYLSRSSRMARSWTITIFIGMLTVFWIFLTLPLAGLLDLKSISKVWPELGQALTRHELARSLVQTQLPTLVLTLLNVAVPYLYDWLSNLQGMISQSEVELSIVSKNYFFTFFNLFVAFTVLSGVSTMFGFWKLVQQSLNNPRVIADLLAGSLEGLAQFYANLIMLQGIGLFPFRLLEFGSVFLYPVSLMGAKTPRDYAELVQPPEFKYGFFLPQTLLVFILCIVYSVLPPWGVYILGFGLIYFIIGHFTYKYQLLYAMDHRQHSTGRAWTIISYRLILGMGVFQVAMAGWLALKRAFRPAAVIVPLIVATIWFNYSFSRTFEPLTQYIALNSIRRNSDAGRNGAGPDADRSHGRDESEATGTSTLDEERERGLEFINPNLISPLEDVWVAKRSVDRRATGGTAVVSEADEDEIV
ncbi:MAG: hypothetical protein M1817_001788 [Caeruleum heppii]|nr:MAG: hypothetical protein M1817_001788 [Caeruleum heppii]